MSKWKSIADIRREYGQLKLDEARVPDDPTQLFEQWFSEVLQTEKSDPTAMVLSTVDEQGHPDSRVVLLKGLENGSFLFYTNYQSHKARHIQANSFVALNFYWPQMARQVRIRGQAEKLSQAQSDAYFATRPLSSQYSAVSSPQSRVIQSRAELEKRLNDLIESRQHKPLLRPEYWGGYAVLADEFEFWQGRDNRLHDRIHYLHSKDKWIRRRLAP